MLRELIAHFRAPAFLKDRDCIRLMPKRFIDDYSYPFHVEISDDQIEVFEELWDLTQYRQISQICERLDQSFLRKTYLGGGIYECEYYASAVEAMLDDAYGSIEETGEVLEFFARWHNTDRKNPYLAAWYATALYNHGFAYRGNDFYHTVSEVGKAKLDEYVDLARDVFDATAEAGQSNWLWRKAFLELATSDYRGLSDHQERYERARECLPLSYSLHKTTAGQLLPRWHGDNAELRQFMEYVYEKTQALCGDELFLIVLDYIHVREEELNRFARPDLAILHEVADGRAQREDDYSLTVACAFYCWLQRYDRVLALMPKIKTLNEAHWYYHKEPKLAFSIAYQMAG